MNLKIEQNFNQIYVKKNDIISFENDLKIFKKKWKKYIDLFENRFLYVKEDKKQNAYFFFQDESEQLDISSSDYVVGSANALSFPTSFIRFLSKAEDNDDFFDYSLGLKYKTGLDPFEQSFYSDFYHLTKKFGEISFMAIVTTTDSNGYWDSTYTLEDGNISLDASYCD